MPLRFRYTLHQLRILDAVVEHGGITRAAQALHLTQPTVSLQVKQLADGLGVPLFEPQGRSLRLTAAGAEVVAFFRAILRSAESLAERLAALEGLTRGRLRLAAASTAEYFIPRLIGRFQGAHPGIAVELRVVNRAEVVARLAADEDDLYVMAQPPSELPVAASPFLANPLVVIAAASHPLATRRSVALADLAPCEFVLREPGSGTRLIADAFFAARGIALRTRLELGSNEAVKQAVIGGLGLAVISLHALSDEITHHARLRVLRVAGLPIPSRWHWVGHAGRPLSRVAHAFVDFLGVESGRLTRELARLQRRSAPARAPGRTPARPA